MGRVRIPAPPYELNRAKKSWHRQERNTSARPTRSRPHAGTHPLQPALADGFSTVPGFVQMSRDGAGHLTGFVFKEFRFERK